ncbi:hypothetical protein V2J09_010237 [Rumex salicifolius]
MEDGNNQKTTCTPVCSVGPFSQPTTNDDSLLDPQVIEHVKDKRNSKECLKRDTKPLRLIIPTMLTSFSLLMNGVSIDERSCWFQNSLNDFVDNIKNFKLQDVDLVELSLFDFWKNMICIPRLLH